MSDGYVLLREQQRFHVENPDHTYKGNTFCRHCGNAWPCETKEMLDFAKETINHYAGEVLEILPALREHREKCRKKICKLCEFHSRYVDGPAVVGETSAVQP